MKQFKVSLNFLLLLFLLIFLFSSCTHKKSYKPNIILFFVDDMGWQDTSVPFYKDQTALNRLYKTPAMEKLASEGMKFTQAYSSSVCSPTRISLMTGMNAARHRVTNWTLHENRSSDQVSDTLILPDWNVNGMSAIPAVEKTVYATPLAQILYDNGYFTIHCGKAHLGAINTPGADPLNLGFNINIAGHAAGAPGSYYGEKYFGNKENEYNQPWGVPGLEEYYGKDIYLSEALTLEATKALDSSIVLNKPFFLYMAHYAVHTPIQEDSRFFSDYLTDSMPVIEAKYASMVESMDKSLGDLMNYLDVKGIADNTIILFMSDNGGLSAVARGGQPHTHNLPLSSGKGSAHEGGIREPMIVKWPNIVKEGSVCNEYLIIEDFFPTILELAEISNLKSVQHIDGISFVPFLKEAGFSSKDRPLFWHFPNNWGPTGPGIGASSTIRKGDWKLIYYHSNQSFELFNVESDIGESINQQFQEPDKLIEMAKELSDYLRDVDAQMPVIKKSGTQVPYPDEILLLK